MSYSDFIIVLAWPEGMVTAAGAWYDKIFLKMNVLSEKNQYRVGHSALILVDSDTNKLHYMDFGRYHTPMGYGRVRDAETDPDISISTYAEIVNGEIKNIKQILKEISNKEASHGEGILYASVQSGVDFKSSYKYAKKLQKKGAVKYGPFVIKGTNCSRFVSKVIRKSGISILKRFRLKIQVNITPSPKRNLSITNPKFYKVINNNFSEINRSILRAYFIDIEKENE